MGVLTEGELKELTALAAEWADSIRDDPSRKSRFEKDPMQFIAGNTTGKAPQVTVGDAVEVAANLPLQEEMKKAGMTILRNVFLQARGPTGPGGAIRNIGGQLREIDFVVLGTKGVEKVVSAKLKSKQVSVSNEHTSLRHFQNAPASGPAVAPYLQDPAHKFGNVPDFAKATEIYVRFEGGTKSEDLEAFRAKYLSKTVVDTIDVIGVTPADERDKGRLLRVTRTELLEKMIELVKAAL
jgi:hypothetical protein